MQDHRIAVPLGIPSLIVTSCVDTDLGLDVHVETETAGGLCPECEAVALVPKERPVGSRAPGNRRSSLACSHLAPARRRGRPCLPSPVDDRSVTLAHLEASDVVLGNGVGASGRRR